MGGLLNALANFIIVAGYLLVPALWLPYLPLTRFVLWSGVIFFGTCALTHLALAFHWDHGSNLLVLNHIVQAISVMCFVTGFSKLLRKAKERQNDVTDPIAPRTEDTGA